MTKNLAERDTTAGATVRMLMVMGSPLAEALGAMQTAIAEYDVLAKQYGLRTVSRIEVFGT